MRAVLCPAWTLVAVAGSYERHLVPHTCLRPSGSFRRSPSNGCRPVACWTGWTCWTCWTGWKGNSPGDQPTCIRMIACMAAGAAGAETGDLRLTGRQPLTAVSTSYYCLGTRTPGATMGSLSSSCPACPLLSSAPTSPPRGPHAVVAGEWGRCHMAQCRKSPGGRDFLRPNPACQNKQQQSAQPGSCLSDPNPATSNPLPTLTHH